MTAGEVAARPAAYAQAAANARAVGFTGVEVHAAQFFFLLNQFLSPLFNHRTAPWVGNPDRRARSARARTKKPLMTAGGFERQTEAEAAISSGAVRCLVEDVRGGSCFSPVFFHTARRCHGLVHGTSAPIGNQRNGRRYRLRRGGTGAG